MSIPEGGNSLNKGFLFAIRQKFAGYKDSIQKRMSALSPTDPGHAEKNKELEIYNKINGMFLESGYTVFTDSFQATIKSFDKLSNVLSSISTR
jgi:hypothetical protein